MALASLLALGVVGNAAHAAQIRWLLQADFDGGITEYGALTADTVTGELSDIFLHYPGDSFIGPRDFTLATPFNGFAHRLLSLADAPFDEGGISAFLQLNVPGDFTDLSASFGLWFAGICENCSPTSIGETVGEYRALGDLFVDPLGITVPEPTTLLLLVSGLAGVAGTTWRARRRKT